MSDRMKMRRRISAYDFSILDLETYLDTHPSDSRAMQLLEMYRKKRQELIHEYEARFGPYVVTRADVSGERWSWVDNPWPWDYEMEG